jgi:hypothetical protein
MRNFVIISLIILKVRTALSGKSNVSPVQPSRNVKRKRPVQWFCALPRRSAMTKNAPAWWRGRTRFLRKRRHGRRSVLRKHAP